MTWPVTDLCGFLNGRWAVARTMVTRRVGLSGTFEGVATVAPCPGGLGYLEEGEVRAGDHCGRASRAWTYLPLGLGAAQVRFPDGRAFHDLDLTAGTWQAVHHCGHDTYRGAFEVISPAVWTVTWNVTGPRKDLRLHTCLTRAA